MAYRDSITDLSMRQIEIFITAASAGSFTKAGEKLFMTQSMVSKSVAAMESILGLTLFERNPKGITLTPAGRILYQGWKDLRKEMSKTVAVAFAADNGYFSQITITDFNTSVKKAYLWPFLRMFNEKYPDVDVFMESTNPADILDKLESNECDIAFAPNWERPAFEQRDFEVMVAYRCPLCAWIPIDNPLCEKESITVQDLKNETFIIVLPIILNHYEKSVLTMCQTAGFAPKKIIEVPNITMAALQMKMGNGIIIRDMVYDSDDQTDVRIFPLEGTDGGTIMAWRKENDNINVKRFVNLYKDNEEYQYAKSV